MLTLAAHHPHPHPPHPGRWAGRGYYRGPAFATYVAPPRGCLAVLYDKQGRRWERRVPCAADEAFAGAWFEDSPGLGAAIALAGPLVLGLLLVGAINKIERRRT